MIGIANESGLRTSFDVVSENLVGAKGSGSSIDTGCNFDGLLTAKLFEQWTNYSESVSGASSSSVHFPNGTLGGAIYTNLDLRVYSHNVRGLSFLARNLVTIDLPGHAMYLKRVSVGPLPKNWPSTPPK